jgi:hypothetical protein
MKEGFGGGESLCEGFNKGDIGEGSFTGNPKDEILRYAKFPVNGSPSPKGTVGEPGGV